MYGTFIGKDREVTFYKKTAARLKRRAAVVCRRPGSNRYGMRIEEMPLIWYTDTKFSVHGGEKMLQQKAPSRTLQLLIGGAILGILAFLLVYGFTPLDITNDTFCRGGYMEKDIQQHYAGWLFYRQNAQGFPLCVTQSINAPSGVSIAYTDSIPLVAALCRPLANWLGGTFQYLSLIHI